MDRQQALVSLQSTDLYVRLGAARFMEKNAVANDRQALSSALASETVPWIVKSLNRALHKLDGDISSHPDDLFESDEDDGSSGQYAQAVQETSKRFVHDMKRLIGFLEVEAMDEIENYATSKTKRHIERLRSLISGIEKISNAAQSAAVTEFNLAELVSEISEVESKTEEIDFSFEGPVPFLAKGDPNLLQLILTSAIRNAIEAAKSSEQKSDRPRLIVTWNKTDSHYWVSILDNGPGLSISRKDAFRLGRSTKSGHFGYGLFQADLAAQSLSGSLDLSSGTMGGATFKVSWPIKIGGI